MSKPIRFLPNKSDIIILRNNTSLDSYCTTPDVIPFEDVAKLGTNLDQRLGVYEEYLSRYGNILDSIKNRYRNLWGNSIEPCVGGLTVAVMTGMIMVHTSYTPSAEVLPFVKSFLMSGTAAFVLFTLTARATYYILGDTLNKRYQRFVEAQTQCFLRLNQQYVPLLFGEEEPANH